MPHISIKMYPGRTEEVKKDLAEKTKDFICQEMNMEEKYISVSVEEIEKDKWNEEGWVQYDWSTEENWFIDPKEGRNDGSTSDCTVTFRLTQPHEEEWNNQGCTSTTHGNDKHLSPRSDDFICVLACLKQV